MAIGKCADELLMIKQFLSSAFTAPQIQTKVGSKGRGPNFIKLGEDIRQSSIRKGEFWISDILLPF